MAHMFANLDGAWTRINREEAMQAAKEPNKRIQRLIDRGYSIKSGTSRSRYGRTSLYIR